MTNTEQLVSHLSYAVSIQDLMLTESPVACYFNEFSSFKAYFTSTLHVFYLTLHFENFTILYI